MIVEVDVIKKVTYQFTIDIPLDKDNIDEEEIKNQAFEAFEKAEENNTLGEHYYDEEIDYDIYI